MRRIIMNVKDTAMKFNTSEYTVKEWCKKGYIRGLKITETGEYDIPSSVRAPYTKNRSKGDAIYTSIVTAVLNNYDVCANLYNMDEGEFETYINQLLEAKLIGTFTAMINAVVYRLMTTENGGNMNNTEKNEKDKPQLCFRSCYGQP